MAKKNTQQQEQEQAQMPDITTPLGAAKHTLECFSIDKVYVTDDAFTFGPAEKGAAIDYAQRTNQKLYSLTRGEEELVEEPID